MKNTIFITMLVFLFSCGNEKPKTKENFDVEIKMAENQAKKDSVKKYHQIINDSINKYNQTIRNNSIDFNIYKGIFVGDFIAEKYKSNKKPSYSNRITISLDSIKNDEIIYGHSIVAGNNRPFEGTFFLYGNGKMEITAKEPGDDKYDGSFEMKFSTKTNHLYGNWYANDTNLAVTERKFTLNKKEFKYNPNLNFDENSSFHIEMYNGQDYYEYYGSDQESITEDIVKYNASTTKLTSKDVENLYKADLEIIRNAIYARHGYSFKNRRMRYFFDRNVDWYIPISTDIRNQLTDLEKENIELLKRYEEHAEKYYDYFGR